MAFVSTLGLFSGVEAALETWIMSFQSVHYFLFLPLVVGAYFLVPAKLRTVWLLVASYYFYFFAAPRYLVILLCGTIFTYLFGLLIAAAASSKRKQVIATAGIIGLVAWLAFFKYNDFILPFLSSWLPAIGGAIPPNFFLVTEALGISFYTFTSIGYLIDLSRGDVPAEKNPLTFALFLSFFPSVLMGPISRASSLLPQLTDTSRKFNPQNAADGLRRMSIGYFKKLAVADTVAIFVNAVFGSSLASYNGFTLGMALLAYAFQLYFDFSGYSDIALGSAQLLGIKIPENFNTPYFSTNFSSFWSRWHISFSAWLQDYIFTPLVWSRWTERIPFIGKHVKKPPVLSSIAVVFLVSGLWHGNTFAFVVWGALQAVYRIGEELLHRFVGKPKKRPPLPSRIGKTLVVFILWVQSLLFFRIGNMNHTTITDAASAFMRQFSGYATGLSDNMATFQTTLTAAYASGIYNHAIIIKASLLFTAVCLLVAIWADWYQFAKCKGKPIATKLPSLPAPAKWLAYYFIVGACFAAFMLQSGGFAGTNFVYGGF